LGNRRFYTIHQEVQHEFQEQTAVIHLYGRFVSLTLHNQVETAVSLIATIEKRASAEELKTMVA